eukprot:450595-Amphidinium_carterae.1
MFSSSWASPFPRVTTVTSLGKRFPVCLSSRTTSCFETLLDAGSASSKRRSPGRRATKTSSETVFANSGQVAQFTSTTALVCSVIWLTCFCGTGSWDSSSRAVGNAVLPLLGPEGQ